MLIVTSFAHICGSFLQELEEQKHTGPLGPAGISTLLSSYATLAYAPPVALLKLLQKSSQAQLSEFEPAQITAMLWSYSLFSALTPEVWNSQTGQLAAASLESVPPKAFTQLYQVGAGRFRARVVCGLFSNTPVRICCIVLVGVCTVEQ